ncbi:hypothetical protein ACSNOB_10810 [Micromonospora sp. URMC 106]
MAGEGLAELGAGALDLFPLGGDVGDELAASGFQGGEVVFEAADEAGGVAGGGVRSATVWWSCPSRC